MLDYYASPQMMAKHPDIINCFEIIKDSHIIHRALRVNTGYLQQCFL